MENNNLKYEEKTKEKEKINSEMKRIQSRLTELKEKIEELNGNEDFKENVEEYKKEKSENENRLKILETEKTKNGIFVPESEGYEIRNGLLEMKRDINLKLIYYLDENKIKQV
jgi:TolA-binding protein